MELIRPGAHGEAVRDVQHRLLAAGFHVDADELEGTYGDSTESAVRAFQQARALPSDGILGPDTWEQLVEAGYRLGDRTVYLRSPSFRGDDVRELQRKLNVLGFDAGKEDGIFGPGTDRGVRDFQRNVASRADGIVGLETVRSIGRYRPAVEAPSRAVVREGEAARGPGIALSGAVIAIDPEQAEVDDADVSLVIAREMVERLRAVAARPVLLRNDSEVMTVGDRIRRANADAAAVLISVAVGTGKQVERGSACFYYGTQSTHSPMGRRLAQSIQEALVRSAGVADAGLHPRSIAILRETRMPAVRVEPAVATDTADAARMADPAFARNIARSVVEGILAFSLPPADLARSS
jgi:N-acetylmuramoyl-L-alanine amidase